MKNLASGKGINCEMARPQNEDSKHSRTHRLLCRAVRSSVFAMLWSSSSFVGDTKYLNSTVLMINPRWINFVVSDPHAPFSGWRTKPSFLKRACSVSDVRKHSSAVLGRLPSPGAIK